MEIKDLRSLVRYNPEKMAKIPVFESDKMFFDLYALLPGQGSCKELCVTQVATQAFLGPEG